MIFFIHPLTILILPVILGAHRIREERKRTEARYQLSSIKRQEATFRFGGEPQQRYFQWNLEKRVKGYIESLKKDEKEKETSQA
jgi:hypothetical protein